MAKHADSGPGLSLRSMIRREAQEIRLLDIVAERRRQAAATKRRYCEARNEYKSLERLLMSRASAELSLDAQLGLAMRLAERSDDQKALLQEWRRSKKRLREAIETLHSVFPPLWLQAWRWITGSAAE